MDISRISQRNLHNRWFTQWYSWNQTWQSCSFKGNFNNVLVCKWNELLWVYIKTMVKSFCGPLNTVLTVFLMCYYIVFYFCKRFLKSDVVESSHRFWSQINLAFRYLLFPILALRHWTCHHLPTQTGKANTFIITLFRLN